MCICIKKTQSTFMNAFSQFWTSVVLVLYSWAMCLLASGQRTLWNTGWPAFNIKNKRNITISFLELRFLRMLNYKWVWLVFAQKHLIYLPHKFWLDWINFECWFDQIFLENHKNYHNFWTLSFRFSPLILWNKIWKHKPI